jgi:hypothetical protein
VISVTLTNDEGAGTLVTGSPLSRRRASKGRNACVEGRSIGVSRRSARNQANPRIGCRVQQTCEPCAEQAAEVGRNDKGGTCSGVATPNLGQPSVDAHGHVDGGAVFEEPHERSLQAFDFGRRGTGGKRIRVSPKERQQTPVRAGKRKLSPR